eukprot:scaffold411322_cov24-Attheya_sp.AAC.1
MSSGAAILRELQLRKRRQQLLLVASSQKGDDGNDSSSTATTANPTQWHSNKKVCHSCIITVCTGINCGAGGMSVVNNNTNRTSSSS